MKLEFPYLILDQFGSFIGAPHELDLESFGPGLHFVRGKNLAEPRLGSNGSGKSTLWSALCWCLYGKTVDGLRNPDIQSRFGKKATTVVVTIRLDGKAHTVARTTHPNRLTKDNKEVGQEQIDDLIGLNYDTFTNTILLGQGQPLFFDLQPKAKLDLFGTVLNLDRWEVRAEGASTATTELEKTEAKLTNQIVLLEGQLTQIETLLAQALDSWRDWKGQQEALELEIQSRLKVLKADHEAKERERAGFDLQYDGAATELRAAQEATRKLAAGVEGLVLARSSLTSDLAIALSQEKRLAEELKTLGTTDTCPTCGQSIKGTDLSHHKTEIKKQLRGYSEQADTLQVKHNALTTKIISHQDELNRSRKSEQEFQHKAENARNVADRLTKIVASLATEIKQLTTRLAGETARANPYTEQVSELKRNKKQLEADLASAQKQITTLREQIEHTRFWVKGFKEVRLYELEDILQELELTTTAALAEVGLVDWIVRYAVEKETKAGTIQRGLNVFIQGPKDKVPVRWECWSGGESQRLRLVGALALSEVLLSRAGVEPMIEILDEPTSHLSPAGIVDLCEFLAERARTLGKQIFYCDHQSVDSVRFTSTLTVIKDHTGSWLE